MIGSLWLQSSLVCHANAFLDGRSGPPPDELPGLEFVKRLSFKVDQLEGSVGDSPTKWFDYLRAQGYDRATLYIDRYENGNTDINMLAFAGAMRAAVLTESSSKETIWYSSETVLDLKDPDRKIWEVVYEGSPLKNLSPRVVATVAEGRKALERSLRALVSFCKETELAEWGTSFSRSLARIDDPNPGFDWAANVFPSVGYGDEVRGLFYAAADSWCFGGMGSWNDQGFADKDVQEKYDQVSIEHYKAILQALYASTAAYERR